MCFLDPTKNCKSCRYFRNLTNLPLHIHSQERIFQDLHRCVLGRVDKCSPVDAHDFCGVSVRVGHLLSWSVGSEQWDTCGSNRALGFWPVIAEMRRDARLHLIAKCAANEKTGCVPLGLMGHAGAVLLKTCHRLAKIVSVAFESTCRWLSIRYNYCIRVFELYQFNESSHWPYNSGVEANIVQFSYVNVI